jgi:hypothetical protein
MLPLFSALLPGSRFAPFALGRFALSAAERRTHPSK